MDVDADYSAPLIYVYTSDQLPAVLSSNRKSSASSKVIPIKSHPQVSWAAGENPPSSVDSVDIEMTDTLEDGSSPVQYPSTDIDMTDAFTQEETAASVPEGLERRETPKAHNDPNDIDIDILDIPATEAIARAEQAKTPSTFEAEVIGLLDKNKIHSISFKDGRLKIRF